MRANRPIPEDIKLVLAMVAEGKLFALQEWIVGGGRVRDDELGPKAACCLTRACEIGFHSVVEVLLASRHWKVEDLNRALGIALEHKRLDLVELLLARGAEPKSADFADVCRTANVELMERFWRGGCDPESENAFARALDDTRAKPLLGFLRSHIEDIPGLKQQASLALACAVEDNKARWAALLVWAGADPHMRVPNRIYQNWELGEYGGRTAAGLACSSEDGQLVKALKLRPTEKEAQHLLVAAVACASVGVLAELLRILKRAKLINVGEPPSCRAIRYFLEFEPRSFQWDRRGDDDESKCRIRCLEMLLEAGAKWCPSKDEIHTVRRSFGKMSACYVVRVIRMLLYVPKAVDRQVVLNFCDTPRIYWLVKEADRELVEEMESLTDVPKKGAS